MTGKLSQNGRDGQEGRCCTLGGGERKIVTLLAGLAEKGIDIKDLIACANSPIKFVIKIAKDALEGRTKP